MNRTQLRAEVNQAVEEAEAKGEFERPAAADVEALKSLWNYRKQPSILSATVSSSVGVIYGDDPDWTSWPSIAARFKAYHAALVDVDNRLSQPLAKMRLNGI